MDARVSSRPLSSESVIYRSPRGYGVVMRVLYGRYYGARDAAVAAHVPAGASVLELCCGPGRLYLHELRGKVGDYVGLDASARFVAHLRALDVDARRADVTTEPLPEADVVIMQASLYQFLPAARTMVDRMRRAARDRVVLAEPVRNLASSRVGAVARLAARSSATAQGAHGHRFDEASLDALMAPLGDAVLGSAAIPGGREKVYILSGAAT